jgi:hypothetical protein
MPYVSDSQRRWAHTAAGIKALGGPAKVAEWDAASKGKKLPERKTRRESIKAAMADVGARARNQRQRL